MTDLGLACVVCGRENLGEDWRGRPVCGACGANPEGRRVLDEMAAADRARRDGELARRTYVGAEPVAPGVVRVVVDGPDPLGVWSREGFYLTLSGQMTVEEWRALRKEIRGWLAERAGDSPTFRIGGSEVADGFYYWA